MDTVSRDVRSRNMRAIRAKNTKPEIILRSYLHREGFRFRLHNRKLPGRPDIWLKKFKTAFFINGCFWHQHKNCIYAVIPKSNTEFWLQKFKSNTDRDKKSIKELRKLGIKTLTVWECQLRDKRTGKIKQLFLNRVVKKITNDKAL